MDAGEIEVVDGLALSSWRNVAINVWREAATVERLRRVREFLRQLKGRFPRTATMTVLDGPAHRLTPEARAEATAIAGEFDGTTVAVAHVLPEGGFVGAAKRMMLSGVMALSRPRYAHRTFDAVDDAAAWVVELAMSPAERLGAAAGLVVHIEEVRRRAGVPAER